MATSRELTTDFEEVFSFLLQYRWVHELPVTKFCERKIWENIPQEWTRLFSALSAEEINRLPFHEKITDSSEETFNLHPLPISLAEFLRKSSALRPCRLQARDRLPGPTNVSKEHSKGMSPKKLHEVEWMASLVHQVAVEAGCSIIVDVGSGLGYLGQVLHQNYGLPVIGLEGSAGHSEGAERRTAKQGLHCSGVKSIPFHITDDSDNIQQFCDLIRKEAKTFEPCHHSSFLHKPSQPSSTAVLDHKVGIQAHPCCPSFHSGGLHSRTLVHSQAENSQQSINSSCDSGVCACGDRKDNHYKFYTNNVTLEGTMSKLGHSDNTFTNKLNSTVNVKPRNSRDSKETSPQTVESDRTGDVGVCLVGLHCCGDLTPAMLRLYDKVTFLRALCCVSCCYHKMQQQPGSDQFSNFPISAAAQSSYAEVCGNGTTTSVLPSSATAAAPPPSPPSPPPPPPATTFRRGPATEHFLTPCSLRLAAQETRTRWASQSAADHERHTRHVGFRALLEVFFQEADWPSLKRNVMRQLDFSSFDRIVESYISLAKILDGAEQQDVRDKLGSLHHSLQPFFSHIEPFTCLQVLLQPVMEWIILKDRQQWLAERSWTSILLPVFDEDVSPRNVALVSTKDP